MWMRSFGRSMIVAYGIIGWLLGDPASAFAQAGAGGPAVAPSSNSDAPPPAVDPATAATMMRLEQRILELEARANAQDKEAADVKAAADARAAAEAKAAADAAEEAAHEPFAFADFSWVPGNAGSSDRPLKWGPFTGEIRVDAVYHYAFSDPQDNSLSGSSEAYRHNEVQLTHLGFGGDFLYKNVQARLMTQFGIYSQGTPRNDSSPARGQWTIDNAYRYISEGYGGYHFDVLKGINVQAGIFMSYIGLWSYYNFDNWTYQPSYISSNTPWFFNGARIQIFVTEKVKVEPWFVNGWQSYGKFNQAPGGGVQLQVRPTEWLSIVGNQYAGTDTLNTPDRKRIHTDDSIVVRYYNNPKGMLSRAAASLTVDVGCEFGGGVQCSSQYFVGFMAYSRLWFMNNTLATTVGGGAITNPSRYLVLLPPVNGATAASGSPYFTTNPGDTYQAWDFQVTLDYMPKEFITLRGEFNHRASSVPYFAGSNGLTPPGGNQGGAGSAVVGWSPDLINSEDRVSLALMVKY